MSISDAIHSYLHLKIVKEPREFIEDSKKVPFERMQEFYKKHNNPLFMAALGSYVIIEKLKGNDPLKV